MTRLGLWRALLLAIVAVACDEPGRSMIGPGTTLNLTGSFSSTTVGDSAGFNSMRWVISQTGNQIAGMVTLAGNGQTGTGTVAGSIDGRTPTFTITVPAGGYSPGIPNCSGSFTGTAENVTNTTISGSYTGTRTCGSAPVVGTMVLQKD